MIKPVVIIHILFLIISNGCRAQNPEPPLKLKSDNNTPITTNLNPDYFLLGTFSDYMGRFRYINRETQVDRYYPYEKPLAEYISTFIEKNYNIVAKPKYSNSGHSEIYSEEIAQKLHSYYTEAGLLKDNIFDTPEKKHSFLSGIILRYGELLFDDVFRVTLANSYNGQLVYNLIKDLGCDKIIYKIRRNNIPVTQVFYFKATPTIMAYYALSSDVNKATRNNMDQMYLNNIKTSQKTKARAEKRDEDEIKSIKYLFEL